jgi:CheY-like chemotaxis protein
MTFDSPLSLPSLAGRRILLVEPDPRALVVHFALLRALGASVAPVPSPMHALRDAAEGPFDAAIVPASAPECPGHVLVEALRRRQPGLPALFCGGAPPGWMDGAPAASLDLPARPALAELCDALHRLLGAEPATRTAPAASGAR